MDTILQIVTRWGLAGAGCALWMFIRAARATSAAPVPARRRR